MQPSSKIIDFHCHYRPPWWEPEPGSPASMATWLGDVRDLEKLVATSRAAGIDTRLLSAPVESVFGIDGDVDRGEIARVNDFLAEAVLRHGDELAGLATIDAYAGEPAADEAGRAVGTLNLPGLVVDSHRQHTFFGAPQTYPLLEAANSLDVPIFVHPVAAPNGPDCVAAVGNIGDGLARGFMNGIAFLTVLQSRAVERWSNLRLVFTGIGAVGLVIAAAELGDNVLQERLAAAEGRICFDVMGLSPTNIRYLREVLGVQQLVIGSDWPIMTPITASAVGSALRGAGLTEDEQAQVSGGNATRLLAGVGATVTPGR